MTDAPSEQPDSEPDDPIETPPPDQEPNDDGDGVAADEEANPPLPAG